MTALGHVLPRLPPQSVRHPGTKHRALPHPARPVEHGQSRGKDVRGDDLALAFAPVEQQSIELGVLERDEALVRTVEDHAGTAPARWRSRSATNSSRATS